MEKSSFKYVCPVCFHEHPVFVSKCPEKGKDVPIIFRQNGRVLNGKYQISSRIGEGGMGVVYRGVHKVIGRNIAVKFLFPDSKLGDEAAARFRKEARIAASIVHKNVVDIIDMDSTSEGIPFIVMEYLDGHDLHDVIQAAGRLSDTVAASLALQILSALNAIHSKGIIHRDLKPENVFIMNQAGGEQIVKIVDFGISHLMKPLDMDPSGRMAETQDGAIVGTPKYMSPEQAGSEIVDRRSDLYSVGVILYEMVTGRLPFEAPNYNKLIVAILTSQATKPSVHNPDLSPELEKIIMKALERNPDARFPSALEFSGSLEKFRFGSLPRRKAAPDEEPSSDLEAKAVDTYAAAEAPRGADMSFFDMGVVHAADIAVIGPYPSRTGPEHILSTSASTSMSDTPHGRRMARKRIIPILIVFLAVAAAAGAYLIHRALTGAVGEGRSVLMLGSLPARMAAEQFDATARKQVLSIDGLPEKASVYVDGVLYTVHPITLEEKDTERLIKIEAPGYRPWSKSVMVQGNTMLSVQMVPVTAAEGEGAAGDEKTQEKKKKKKDAQAGEGAQEAYKTGEKTTGQEGKKKIDTMYPGLKK